jgi:hypothetical protein
MVVLGLAAVLAATEVRAQQAPAAPPAPAAPADQAPAPAAAPADQARPDPLKFTSEAGMIIWAIKPENVADFEKVMGVLMSRLAASDNPDLKALGDSMKSYKPVEQGKPGDPVTIFTRIDPPSKTTTYDPAFLLFQAKKADGMTTLFERAEADELYKLLQAGVVGINALPLQVVK